MRARTENGHSSPRRHELPALPYEYDALEPYISQRTMRLHHSVHHRAHVDELNRVEEALTKARSEQRREAGEAMERRLAFNESGHLLHTIFWTNMHPEGGGLPTDEELLRQIERDFGSFEAFRDRFTAAANSLQGNGWVLLVWRSATETFEILQVEQNHYTARPSTTPVLVLDLWEHAYYLQYQARRPDYVESWWNVVNWPDVARRLRCARHGDEAVNETDGHDEENSWEAGDDSDREAPTDDTAAGDEKGVEEPGRHDSDGTEQFSRTSAGDDAHLVRDDAASVQTVYGSRSAIHRALWAGAVKGGATTRTGTVRPAGRRRRSD